jgi:DHA1 family multidrug resistance protein-like MFS transporter
MIWMNNKRNLVILFITLVIMMMGFGIIIPILPDLVVTFGGSGVAMGALMAIFSAMQFLFSPMWGGLSDRFGRKPILMLGVFGNAISMVALGLSTQLWMLFAARGLAGILSSATLPTAMAYISDSTDEKSRGGGMGVIGAAMGLGMILGPGAGGMLSSISLQAPFYFAAALSLLAMAAIRFFLPESLAGEKRGTALSLQGPQIRAMWESLFGPIAFLFIAAFMISFAVTNFEGIYAYYAKDRYGYGPETIGYILTAIGVVSVIAQGALTGIATRKFGEVNVIKVSLIASVAGFLVMLLAKDLTTVILTASFFVLANAMLRPAVSSLISQRTTQGQGIAMGLNNAYMSLGRVIGPLWAGAVIDINMFFPFITGAAVMLLGFLTSLVYLKGTPSPAARPAVESAD